MKFIAIAVMLLLLGTAFPLTQSATENHLRYQVQDLDKRSENNHSKTFNCYRQWTSPSPQEEITQPINDLQPERHQQAYYSGKTLRVGGKGLGNFSTIQTALKVATDGDTIFVYSGSYHVWPSLEINKSICLQGENPETTIISTKGEHLANRPVILIETDNVKVSGFTLKRNYPSSALIQEFGDCGVWIQGGKYCVITDNIFMNGICGVLLFSPNSATAYNSISDNTFKDNICAGLALEGVNNNIIENNTFEKEGIEISTSNNNVFRTNTIDGKPLVVLENQSNTVITDAAQIVLIRCTNITIIDCDISNAYIGIRLTHSKECTISDNNLKGCYEVGIYLEYSNDNIITNNVIDTCYGGLLIGESNHNTIQSNYVTGNWFCSILLSMSSQNSINANTLKNNANYSMVLGFLLTGGATNNDITNNTFINDTLYTQYASANRIINNTVNGKPLIYLEQASGKVFDYPIGQLILISCGNIKICNQTDIEIHLFACDHCQLENVSGRPNKYVRLFICYSQVINVTHCNFSNGGYGIQVSQSSHCTFQNTLFTKNSYVSLFVVNDTDITILHNSFEKNIGGYMYPSLEPVYIEISSSIEVRQNNFIDNFKGEYFNGCSRKAITWNGNYWDKPRTLPKIIPGRRAILYQFDLDLHPAQTPYDIS